MQLLKSLFSARDMTEGAPWKNLLVFAVPMLIGNIVQQLYNTADTIIVGRYVGDNALAAVGGAGPILNLLIVLFVGVASGAGIMVAQYFGAKQREELSHTIGICLTLLTLLSVFVMIFAPLVTRPLLRLLNTPDAILEWSAQYLDIMFWGVLGVAYYNILTGIIRGLGDSFSTLIYLIIACIMNIVLDLLFVAVFGMGVRGAAIATIISQFVSGFLCLWRLMQMRDVFDMGAQYLRPTKKYVGQILRLGLPTGISQAMFSLALVFVQSLTNSFGEMFVACNVIVMRVDGFVMMPNFTFSNAMMVFTGQNVGAGKIDNVKTGAKQCMYMAMGTAIVIVAGILLFGRQLIQLFTQTEELIDLSVYMLRILAGGYIAFAIAQVPLGVIRGAGDTMTPMWISFLTTIVIRIPVAYLLANLTGRPESIFISLLVAWTLNTVFSLIAFRVGKWRTKGIINRTDPGDPALTSE